MTSTKRQALGFIAVLAVVCPFAVGCNRILGIKEHGLADGGGGAGGGGGTGGSAGAGILACSDPGVNGAVDAAVGTACGFTMPNPVGSGLPHAASYTVNPQDDSVIDNVTGLIWERNVDPGDYRQSDADNYCRGKGGDWRLPIRIELVSLLDFTVSNPNPVPPPDPTTVHPMISPMFSNAPAERFWSSSKKPGDPNTGWAVGFDVGNTRQKQVTDTYRVRCVRRPPSQCSPTGYQVNEQEGTVYDVATGLTWQRAIADRQDWDSASTYCSAQFGSAWRLPSLTELQTIVDETQQDPSIDREAFPCTPISDFFWTAAQYVGDTAWAYYVTFIHGHSDIQAIGTRSFVRCVKP